MSRKFSGRITVVTGASAGIGLATAKRFVQEDMDHVFITGRGKDALDAAAAEIGKGVTAVQGDVANLSDLDRLYNRVKNHEAGPVWIGGREVRRPSFRRQREGAFSFPCKRVFR